jgi:hypothetical protein
LVGLLISRRLITRMRAWPQNYSGEELILSDLSTVGSSIASFGLPRRWRLY